MDLVVYTAVYGPKAKCLADPVFSDPHVPMVCFTDRRDLKSKHWCIIRNSLNLPPERANRLLKILSHKVVSSEWSLYLDSNFVLLRDPRTFEDYGDFVTHKHRKRHTISSEAQAIISYRKADPQLVQRQVAAYHQEGFDTPKHPQEILAENGVLLRHHTPEVAKLNTAWWEEVVKHSHRDQLSLDYVAWKQAFELHYWPGSVSGSRLFRRLLC